MDDASIAVAAAVYAIDHVQLAMPPGGEAAARAFYAGVLGFTEVPKPAHLAARGGVWFVSGAAHVHLGVASDFTPARKAHPALLTGDLDGLAARCAAAGHPAVPDQPLDGHRRRYVADPFGNRIELMEKVGSTHPQEIP